MDKFQVKRATVESEDNLNQSNLMESTDYDYFSPALMDCWPQIIDHVKRPQDIQAVMNTSDLFYAMVEPRVFTELIFPVLLHNESYLGKGGILTCRQLSHQIKAQVDYTLNQVPHPWIEDHLDTSEDIEWLMEKAKDLPDFNPFMHRSIETFYDNLDDLKSAVEMFKAFGQYLTSVKFYLPNEYRAGPMMELMIDALKYLPHLQSLRLITTQAEHGEDDRTLLEPIPPSRMPKLNKLFKLQLLSFIDEDGGVGQRPAAFLQSFLNAYGKQVTNFSSNEFLFHFGFDVEFFNVNLSNVEHYKVYNFDDIVAAEHGVLSQVSWPKLTSIDIFSGAISFTPEGLQTILNFRASLTEIRFPHLICEDIDQILETQPDDFPNVKQIILCPSNVGLPVVLRGFPRFFPNLEHIKFLPDYIHLNEPIPELSVRQSFFKSYPKLETFVWSRCVSYSKWMDNEFRRKDVIPFSRVYYTKKCS
ncbi:U2 small nuclear ribonucleoprotein A' [Orchesella cincta]|uniref:U2 small nuclear ribonucleoprotein A n=1 Tax=Orchesella cincta TaxID=48709 RepID=A0A1D2MFE0_ORCCI|nr:U2 small nuclear ribonucleoprotein A' [Orchesella cincta]